ncbi:hypothetical protein [Flaviaesturariibacter terrae]
MAYSFYGFIGALEPIQRICSQYIFARNVPLGQDIFLIPLSDELQEQMNGSVAAEPLDGFELLTAPIETALASASISGPIAYAEVTHWAGEGHEAGVLWEGGKRQRTIRFGKGVINTMLKGLGCVAAEGEDEFGTLGFGRRRFTDDWLQQ